MERPPLKCWSRRLSAKEPPSSVHNFSRPPILEALSLLPVAYRVGQYIGTERRNGREPIFDLNGIALEPPHPGPHAGCPCGGIGAGAIGRGFKGDFRRWSIFPGKYIHKSVLPDQFSLRVTRNNQTHACVLAMPEFAPAQGSYLSSWGWHGMRLDCAEYHAVFPRSWTVYHEPLPGVVVTIRQVSPFIPHNYADSSLPVVVFHVNIENIGDEDIEASVMFTFQNGDGTAGANAPLGPFVHAPFSVSEQIDLNQQPSSESHQLLVIGSNSLYSEYCGVFMESNSASKEKSSSLGMGLETARAVNGSYAVCATRCGCALSEGGASSDAGGGDGVSCCSMFVSEPAAAAGASSLDGACAQLTKMLNTSLFEDTDRQEGGDRSGDVDDDDCRCAASTSLNNHNSDDRLKFSCDTNNTAFNRSVCSAEELWCHFECTGQLPFQFHAIKQPRCHAAVVSAAGERVASAICVKQTVKSKSSSSCSFSLAWDHPMTVFGAGKAVPRFYTKFVGTSGHKAHLLAAYALQQAQSWEEQVCAWQDEALALKTAQASTGNNTDELPEYFQYHLFNELYYLVDGGTVWSDTCNGVNNRNLVDELENLASDCNPAWDSPIGHCTAKLRKTEDDNADISHHLMVASFEDSLKLSYANELTVIKQRLADHNEIADNCIGQQEIIGQFLYLEGHEYLMYNTYDVHFYSSFALLMLFPQLELSLQRDFAAAVSLQDDTSRQMMGEGNYRPRKMKGVVPHDLGSPSEDPWIRTNAYNFQDVSNWKDLGSKFVLQIYRDYVFMRKRSPEDTNILSFLMDLYPVVQEVMKNTELFDTDGDGMIENSGFPDQTYDIWTASGVHAYCGGLWIAACCAMSEMASIMGDNEQDVNYYKSLADTARAVYIAKLWNGQYLNYDSSSSAHHDSVMADMLAGHWYAAACDLAPVLPEHMASSCLQVIFKHNVKKFGAGKWKGAVNGTRPGTGDVDNCCLQSREVWTGTTYALAATMLQQASYQDQCVQSVTSSATSTTSVTMISSVQLRQMAYETAQGIHDAGWQDYGYWFATPEAWEMSGNYRSLGYMRPLSIWAMQYARVMNK